jgi:hypothetical protein
MNIVTKYPVLVNPVRPDINDYKLNDPKFDLPGAIQKVAVGDFVIKGTNPVFDNDKEVTQNEFMYLKEIDSNGEVLTPMDQYLYSGRNYSDGAFDFGEFTSYGDVFENFNGQDLLGNPFSKPKTNPLGKPLGTSYSPTKITPAQFSATVKDIPGGPTAAEQVDKAKKEGKFWNSLKGGYEKFKVTENGQIIVNSAMALLLNKLGGPTGTTTDTAPTADGNSNEKLSGKQPMSKTTKTILIVGGVAVVGLIIYSVLKRN